MVWIVLALRRWDRSLVVWWLDVSHLGVELPLAGPGSWQHILDRRLLALVPTNFLDTLLVVGDDLDLVLGLGHVHDLH